MDPELIARITNVLSNYVDRTNEPISDEKREEIQSRIDRLIQTTSGSSQQDTYRQVEQAPDEVVLNDIDDDELDELTSEDNSPGPLKIIPKDFNFKKPNLDTSKLDSLKAPTLAALSLPVIGALVLKNSSASNAAFNLSMAAALLELFQAARGLRKPPTAPRAPSTWWKKVKDVLTGWRKAIFDTIRRISPTWLRSAVNLKNVINILKSGKNAFEAIRSLTLAYEAFFRRHFDTFMNILRNAKGFGLKAYKTFMDTLARGWDSAKGVFSGWGKWLANTRVGRSAINLARNIALAARTARALSPTKGFKNVLDTFKASKVGSKFLQAGTQVTRIGSRVGGLASKSLGPLSIIAEPAFAAWFFSLGKEGQEEVNKEINAAFAAIQFSTPEEAKEAKQLLDTFRQMKIDPVIDVQKKYSGEQGVLPTMWNFFMDSWIDAGRLSAMVDDQQATTDVSNIIGADISQAEAIKSVAGIEANAAYLFNKGASAEDQTIKNKIALILMRQNPGKPIDEKLLNQIFNTLKTNPGLIDKLKLLDTQEQLAKLTAASTGASLTGFARYDGSKDVNKDGVIDVFDTQGNKSEQRNTFYGYQDKQVAVNYDREKDFKPLANKFNNDPEFRTKMIQNAAAARRTDVKTFRGAGLQNPHLRNALHAEGKRLATAKRDAKNKEIAEKLKKSKQAYDESIKILDKQYIAALATPTIESVLAGLTSEDLYRRAKRAWLEAINRIDKAANDQKQITTKNGDWIGTWEADSNRRLTLRAQAYEKLRSDLEQEWRDQAIERNYASNSTALDMSISRAAGSVESNILKLAEDKELLNNNIDILRDSLDPSVDVSSRKDRLDSLNTIRKRILNAVDNIKQAAPVAEKTEPDQEQANQALQEPTNLKLDKLKQMDRDGLINLKLINSDGILVDYKSSADDLNQADVDVNDSGYVRKEGNVTVSQGDVTATYFNKSQSDIIKNYENVKQQLESMMSNIALGQGDTNTMLKNYITITQNRINKILSSNNTTITVPEPVDVDK